MPPTPPELLTTREVAKLLRVNASTVYRWRQDGILRGIKVGKTVRFRRAEVLALLEPEEKAG